MLLFFWFVLAMLITGRGYSQFGEWKEKNLFYQWQIARLAQNKLRPVCCRLSLEQQRPGKLQPVQLISIIDWSQKFIDCGRICSVDGINKMKQRILRIYKLCAGICIVRLLNNSGWQGNFPGCFWDCCSWISSIDAAIAKKSFLKEIKRVYRRSYRV